MGLLKALFKKKSVAASLPRQDGDPSGVDSATQQLNNFSLSERDGAGQLGRGTNLPPGGIAPPWSENKLVPALPGDNSLDNIVDIPSISMEAVDYNLDDGACFPDLVGQDMGVGSSGVPAAEDFSQDGSPADQDFNPLSEEAETANGVDIQRGEGSACSADEHPEDIHDGGEGQTNEERQPEDSHDLPNALDSPTELTAEALAPLQNMVYLTQDDENMADTISVVSDTELPGDIAELGRALETLETLKSEVPRSPLARQGGSGAGGGAILGSSPGGSLSTASLNTEHFAKNMVKLYNDLALKLMEAKEYTQALNMLRKAEALLDNDAMWVPGEDRVGSGSLVGSFNLERTSGSFHLTTQESSMDEGGTPLGTAGSFTPGSNPPNDFASDATAAERIKAKRDHLRAITYNNLGCLFKRRGLPEQALPYLQNALSLEESGGKVHDCASTHLNLCASFSALTRFREALAHAERAIILLQRKLWGPSATSFQEGVAFLARTLSALHATVTAGPGDGRFPEVAAAYGEAHRRQRKLLESTNILAMAYHNAAVEHERLNRMREAHVSYSRACSLGTRFLPKSSTTTALVHAQKAFQSRQQRDAAGFGGAAHHGGGGHGHTGGSHSATANRKGPSTLSSRNSVVGGGLGGKSRSTSSVKRSGTSTRSASSLSRVSKSTSVMSKLGRERR